MIRLATVFSGIGAIEHALYRMELNHKIIFACDNGGLDIFKPSDILQIQADLKSIGSDWVGRKKKIDDIYSKLGCKNKVKQSYMANYNLDDSDFHWNAIFLNGKQYKDQVDLFVGGSPCQSFSLVGKQRGLEDTRGTLFYEYARLVDEIKPKVFIYENVRAVISNDGGNTWQKMQQVFSELGYRFKWQILNAKDYGIPQNRERLFVVGFREDLDLDNKFDFPKPIKLNYKLCDFLINNMPYGFYLPKKHFERFFINNSLHEECDLEKYYLSEKMKQYVLSSGTKNFYSKPETDLEIARPLLATMHKMHRAGVDNYVTTDGKLRRLTPRECLRLMGFSDDFKIVVSDTAMYQQAGNSIVVDVLIHILEEIMSACPSIF